MAKGFALVKEVLAAFHETRNLLPTSPDTPDEGRTKIRSAISALHSAIDGLPARSRKRKGNGNNEEEEQRADWLDEEGVGLWNLALAAQADMPPDPAKADLLLLAHVKYAAFRFIDAATGSSVVGPFLTRLMDLAAGAISALLGAGDLVKANSLCITAAELEQKLSGAPLPPESTETKERLEALLAYYIARCDTAMAEDNEPLGFTMMTKAADQAMMGGMDSESLMRVAHKCWEVGNALRERDAPDAEPSIWLQKGLEIMAKADAEGPTPRKTELQIALLRSTARAELAKKTPDRANIDRATSALKKLGELSNTLDPNSVQEIKIIKLHVLQQQGAKERSIRECLEDIVANVVWDEEGVMGVLAEISSLQSNDLQALGRLQLLTQAVSDSAGRAFVTAILMAILLSCRKHAGDFQAAYRLASQALDKLATAEINLSSKPDAIACQTVLWSLGELAHKNSNLNQAAQWYVLGAHSAFKPGGSENFGKCRRRAALAYINCDELDRAKELLQECPAFEASTQYLSFLVAINLGREIAAITAIEQIVNCPDLDGKQLLLMGQAAQEKGMTAALNAALAAVLTAITQGGGAGTVPVHALTLVRCLIDLNLAEIRDTDKGERDGLNDTFLYFLRMGHQVINELFEKGEAADHIKAIAWIYKTAYNAGVESAMEWGPSLAADIFDIAAQIMELVHLMPEIDTDIELPVQRATAMFACFTGKLEVYRCMEEGEEKDGLLRDLLVYVSDVRSAIEAVDSSESEERAETATAGKMLIAISILEAELLCEQRNWEGLEKALETVIDIDQAGGGERRVLEAFVTVLAQYSDCPTRLTIATLEHLLESFSPDSEVETTHLARWTHHLIAALMHRGSPGDEERAFFYLDKIVIAMESRVFPDDESRWFASVAWNNGTKRFSLGNNSVGHEWCQLALQIASRIERSQGVYKQMVARYQMMQQRFGIAR